MHLVTVTFPNTSYVWQTEFMSLSSLFTLVLRCCPASSTRCCSSARYQPVTWAQRIWPPTWSTPSTWWRPHWRSSSSQINAWKCWNFRCVTHGLEIIRSFRQFKIINGSKMSSKWKQLSSYLYWSLPVDWGSLGHSDQRAGDVRADQSRSESHLQLCPAAQRRTGENSCGNRSGFE